MRPVDFKQSTKILRRPGTMSDVECGALPVWSDGKQCVSCWRPSMKERIRILFGGKVWLGVMSGKTQPAVFVSGENVFRKVTPLQRFMDYAIAKWKEVMDVFRMIRSASLQCDKRKHFVVGLVVSMAVGVLAPLCTGCGVVLGSQIGAVTGCLVGAIKERVDASKATSGAAELMDYVFTAIGSVVGSMLSILSASLLMFFLP